jgi:hypothetical protein
MTTFEDKLFALIHGLPVADEPMANLESGPSKPGVMAAFDEQMRFNHAMGKTADPVDDSPFAELLTKARAFIDVPKFTTVTSRIDERNRRIITKFSTGNVIAELDENNCVIRTYFEPAA